MLRVLHRAGRPCLTGSLSAAPLLASTPRRLHTCVTRLNEGIDDIPCVIQNMVNGIVEKTRSHITPSSIESIVPDAPLRTVSAHEGGAYTLAFDRLVDC